jgi:hypothetical protein
MCRVDYCSSQSAINLKVSKRGCFSITPPRSWPSDRDVTFAPLVLYTADILFPWKEKCIILLPWQHKDDVTRLSSRLCCYMWYNRLLHQASNKGLLYVIRKKRHISRTYLKRLPSLRECGAFPARIVCTQFCFILQYLRCWHNNILIVGRHKCPHGLYDNK